MVRSYDARTQTHLIRDSRLPMHGLAGENESQFPRASRDADPLLVEAALLRARPGFSQAVRAYTASLVRFRGSLQLANKLLAQETRFRTLRLLLYLDADHERYGPNGGATYGRLLELCTRRKEISPRVLKTVLALLSLTGFVETRRSDTDRRLKFYRPTARMLAYARQRIALALEALDIAQPEIRRMQMLQDNPDLIRQVLASAGREHIRGAPLADRMPDFMSFFGGREGAAPIVYTIMLADIDDTVPPSRAEMARRYALSKSQVSNVIAQGEALGYFALDAAGAPSATPHLRDHFARWISIDLAFHARHMGPASLGY